MWQACTDGDLEVVKELADDPAVDINWGDPEDGRTSFYRACGRGRTDVVEYLMRNPGVDSNRASNEGATPFNIACQEGHKEVVSLLLANPGMDPNKTRNDGTTAFFMASQYGHKEVISLLLADPRVDPDIPRETGATPFFIACECGYKEVVLLLLADPRIDPNKSRNDQTTPLWYASQNGHLVVVQHLLASEKEIDTRRKSAFNKRTAAEHARVTGGRATKRANETEDDFHRRKTKGPLCADLIDEYECDPVTVRHRLRRQPCLREYFIGHLFALVVFHSDSFTVINGRTAHFDTKRFFRLCARLPLEVQMIICNLVFVSPKDIILSGDSEPGFKCLARTTTWQQ